jgi:NIMA (never in mitosis gene a)-related kinase
MESCGFPIASDGSFLGSRGGLYKPVNILGRGSFGTCVLVKKAPEAPGANAGALRVVKTVDLLHASDEDTTCRWSEALREAEVLKSLRHPNIIGYEDAFLADTHLCIVMEYADGGDLAAAIARRRESGRRYHEREAMAIFAQLALALRHVHALRILHRDVKSQNVFLTSTGVVKLGDFGVAKVLDTSELCAATRIGTPQCVPPELCENHPYDFKADVWGLGVILYQLLALECPFNGASFAALAVRICTAEPRPVPSVYSPDARMLLSRLLAKRADDRPSSVEILAMPHVRRSVAALPGRQLAAEAEAAAARSASPCSPLRVLRRRAANALRRCATVPECGSPEVARARKGAAAPKKSRATSPQKAKASSPRKLRTVQKGKEWGSPKKARMLQAPHLDLAALVPAAEEDFAAADALTSPGSRGSVSDLLALFLESPIGGGLSAPDEKPLTSSRSEGAATTSTRAATGDGGSARSAVECYYHGAQAFVSDCRSEGRVAEDLPTCTALLASLEREFGLA